MPRVKPSNSLNSTSSPKPQHFKQNSSNHNMHQTTSTSSQRRFNAVGVPSALSHKSNTSKAKNISIVGERRDLSSDLALAKGKDDGNVIYEDPSGGKNLEKLTQVIKDIDVNLNEFGKNVEKGVLNQNAPTNVTNNLEIPRTVKQVLSKNLRGNQYN